MAALQNNETAPTMVMSYGTGLNDLGNYDACTLTPGLKYATISILAEGFGSHMGMCIPEDCSMDDFEDGVVAIS